MHAFRDVINFDTINTLKSKMATKNGGSLVLSSARLSTNRALQSSFSLQQTTREINGTVPNSNNTVISTGSPGGTVSNGTVQTLV